MASRTKVAYVLTPITFGGAEKVSLNFLRTVDRNRFDIKPVLFIRPWEEELYFARELRQLGYTFETVPVALKTDSDPMRVPRVAHRLHSYLKKGSFDLVHTHGYFADICGQPAALALGINSISTCHGFIASDLKLKIYIRLDKYVLRMCRMVIAVSEGIRDELVHSGIRDSRITVIPNAVSLLCENVQLLTHRQETRRTLGIAPDEIVVGYLGRLSEEKGLIYLVEAAAELRDAAVLVKFLIVGDGPEKAALEQQVNDRELSNLFTFLGFRTATEKLYPAFDIFVLPSLTEGSPLALLESMAAGVPVIASAVGGIPKVVTDGVNGLLVSPGDPIAIKEKIRLLSVDSELSQRLGRAGIDTIKAKYNIDSWCREIEQCYGRV